MYKQVIVVRNDIKMSRGKLAAQCAHAAISALEKSSRSTISAWKKEGQKKIVLKVEGIEDIFELQKKCTKMKLTHATIADAGLTELKPGTITAIAIGPDKSAKIDKLTGKLKVL